VKPLLKPREPPCKTKYALLINSEKYREGKMKRTLMKGVKRIWNQKLTISRRYIILTMSLLKKG